MIDEKLFRQISDRLEIENLLILYCSAIDSKAFDVLDNVFTPDAIIDYSSGGYLRGRLPEIKAWLSKALEAFPVTQHLITNITIQIEGDHATSRCYMFNPMCLSRKDKDPPVIFFGGAYNDKLVRTKKGWRIAERIHDLLWNYGNLPEDLEIPNQ